MREILFKAKRIDNGEWVEGYYSKSPDPMLAFLKDFIFAPYFDKEKECGYDNGYKIDINTLCQYTGLTDKNGNKIWENDILCTNNKEKYIVKWRFGGFEMHHRAVATPIYAYAGTDLYLDENTLNLEVIGDTFDNPKLLQEKDEELER